MTLTLKASTGQFVCAENGGDDIGLVTATRDVAGPWETFTLETHGDKVAIRTVNGRYFCAEDGGGGALHANRLVAGPWELFRMGGSGGRVTFQSLTGHYICAEGGGGRELVVNRSIPGPWETFTSNAGSAVARKGIPRPNRFQVVDDGGGWLAVGTSLFWGPYGFLRERERLEQHLTWIAGKGFDFVRVICTGLRKGAQERSISPSDPQFSSAIAGLADLAKSKGLRVQFTIFGATYDAPTPQARRSTIDKVGAALKDRTDAVWMIEIANEGWQNGFPGEAGARELKDLAARMTTWLPNLVATTCPHSGDDVTGEGIAFYYKDSAATAQTHHYARRISPPNGIWRPTGKPWRESHFVTPGCAPFVQNNEPRGPESSVSETNDPLVLAVDAGTSWLCGIGSYVLHCGAGIYGVADSRGPGSGDDRPADLWDTQQIEAICAGIQITRGLLPPDLPNWTKHKANGTNAPFHFVDVPEEQFALAYSATSGNGIVQIICGVTRATTFTLRSGTCAGKVYHPFTGQVLETFTREFHVSPGQPAVIVVATRQ